MPLKSRCDLKKTQLSAYLPLNDKTNVYRSEHLLIFFIFFLTVRIGIWMPNTERSVDGPNNASPLWSGIG